MTISYFTKNLSVGFLSLLYHIVCVYALVWPKIRNKILTSGSLYNFVSNHKELSIVDKHIIHYPWRFSCICFKSACFLVFFLSKKILVFRI